MASILKDQKYEILVTNIGSFEDFESHVTFHKRMKAVDADDQVICYHYFLDDGTEAGHWFPGLRRGTIFKTPRVWHNLFKDRLQEHK